MDRMRQEARLIVPPREQPGPMERHREDEIDAVEDLAAAAAHPAAERARQVGAVAMLQRQHETTAGLVISHDGSPPVPARPLARAVVAPRALTHRLRTGQA